MTPEKVLRLSDAANQISQFSGNPEWVFLADHVKGELHGYNVNGEPLPVDREWLLGLDLPTECVLTVTIYPSDDVYIGRKAGYELKVGNIRDFTRPRFLALLAGLGIEVKHGV